MSATATMIDEQRWNRAVEYAAGLCEADEIPAVAMGAGGSDWWLPPVFVGRHAVPADSPPLRDDAIFLIASITKPVVATAVLMLVARGLLALGDRVAWGGGRAESSSFR